MMDDELHLLETHDEDSGGESYGYAPCDSFAGNYNWTLHNASAEQSTSEIS